MGKHRAHIVHVVMMDLSGVLVLAALSMGLGLGMNHLRARPLDAMYRTPRERILASELLQVQPGVKMGEIIEISMNEMRRLTSLQNVIILDARPDLFYEDGHIPSALNLPRDDFDRRLPGILSALRDPKIQKIVVYCAEESCEDGHTVALGLQRLGLGDIHIFRGGWSAWDKARFKVQRGAPSSIESR